MTTCICSIEKSRSTFCKISPFMFHGGKKVTCLDHGHDGELHFHTVPCKSARSVELKGLFTSIIDSLILASTGFY